MYNLREPISAIMQYYRIYLSYIELHMDSVRVQLHRRYLPPKTKYWSKASLVEFIDDRRCWEQGSEPQFQKSFPWASSNGTQWCIAVFTSSLLIFLVCGGNAPPVLNLLLTFWVESSITLLVGWSALIQRLQISKGLRLPLAKDEEGSMEILHTALKHHGLLCSLSMNLSGWSIW